MLKFLIILVLIIYVFYKVAGFLFRMVFGNLRSDPGQQFQSKNSRYAKKANGSSLNIDRIPQTRSRKKREGYQGGEYVDYEEVK